MQKVSVSILLCKSTVSKFLFIFNKYKNTHGKFKKSLKEEIVEKKIKKWIKIKIVSWTLLFRWAWGYCKLVRHLDRLIWGQKGIKKEKNCSG